MYNWYLLSKFEAKLFFKNKKRIGLILLLMMSCTLILNARMVAENQDMQKMHELSIFVVDLDDSLLSQKILNAINENTNFLIRRVQAPNKKEDMMAFLEMQQDMYGTRVYLHIEKDFEKAYLENDEKQYIHLYKCNRDERENYLEELITNILVHYEKMKVDLAGNREAFDDKLLNDKQQSKNTSVYVEGNKEQLVAPVGYSFSYSIFICTLSYVIIYLASCLIDNLEREKRLEVNSRIALSRINTIEFLGSKVVGSMLLLLQSVLGLVIGLNLFVKQPIDLTYFQISFSFFGYSVVVMLSCILVQILLKSVDKTLCVIFVGINIGNLMTGICCYIDTAPVWVRNVALIFPQRWLIWLREEVMTGRTNALLIYMGIMLFYALFLILLIWAYLYFVKNRAAEEENTYAIQ